MQQHTESRTGNPPLPQPTTRDILRNQSGPETGPIPGHFAAPFLDNLRPHSSTTSGPIPGQLAAPFLDNLPPHSWTTCGPIPGQLALTVLEKIAPNLRAGNARTTILLEKNEHLPIPHGFLAGPIPLKNCDNPGNFSNSFRTRWRTHSGPNGGPIPGQLAAPFLDNWRPHSWTTCGPIPSKTADPFLAPLRAKPGHR